MLFLGYHAVYYEESVDMMMISVVITIMMNLMVFKLISLSRHLEANATSKHSISLGTHPLPQVCFFKRIRNISIYATGENKIL